MKLAYCCMGNPMHSFKYEKRDGLRCPVCQRPVAPTSVTEEGYNSLPEYKELKMQCRDSEKEIEVRRLASIKYSGSFTSTNRDGPGELVNSLLKEDFDWLVEQLEKRINKDI